ncbi:hypothetical protein DERF_004490 [Dermatophagoides farinae]|uniref:Transmembrane protein n=1 Tax=Dermatophagoides farinae TaxID=6954 RepID=A0A922I405_DERFA|nr:hypothetical protein DERF_004490 [Dermatophagoides farinae]
MNDPEKNERKKTKTNLPLNDQMVQMVKDLSIIFVFWSNSNFKFNQIPTMFFFLRPNLETETMTNKGLKMHRWMFLLFNLLLLLIQGQVHELIDTDTDTDR